MKPWLPILRVVATLSGLLGPGLTAAWTEAELLAADRVLERRLEQRWAAEADAQDRAAAAAKARADAALQAESQARLERQLTMEALAQGLVTLPGGTFTMGCGPTDGACETNEGPTHRVSMRPFRIGRYEVTQAQWTAVMGTNPAQIQDAQRPVEMVSWDDIQQFLKRLNADNEGPSLRLPTEAEWEYAARAGTQTAWWWGPEVGRGNANCDGCGSPAVTRETAQVGSFLANPFGLYDTAGNVAEWLQDCYHETYVAAPTDGSEWGDACPEGYRVVRGGSWLGRPPLLRSAARQRGWRSDRGGDRGFRLAQDL